MIHTFDPVIYPRKLWITYDATPEECAEQVKQYIINDFTIEENEANRI